jgi:HJR/Mrr/RecB family endonuclease
VTIGNYTTNAIELARQSKVRLLSRNELGAIDSTNAKPNGKIIWQNNNYQL